jgi:hypothetical protein
MGPEPITRGIRAPGASGGALFIPRTDEDTAMRKKLRIEALQVDSFEASSTPALQRGTVRGFDGSEVETCASGTPSCLGTCDDTCGLTCWESCFFDLTCGCG